jgi:hypothetical protein
VNQLGRTAERGVPKLAGGRDGGRGREREREGEGEREREREREMVASQPASRIRGCCQMQHLKSEFLLIFQLRWQWLMLPLVCLPVPCVLLLVTLHNVIATNPSPPPPPGSAKPYSA